MLIFDSFMGEDRRECSKSSRGGGGLLLILFERLDDKMNPIVKVKKKVKKSDNIADRKNEEKKLKDFHEDVLTAYLEKLQPGNRVKEQINSIKVDMIVINKDTNNKFDEVLIY